MVAVFAVTSIFAQSKQNTATPAPAADTAKKSTPPAAPKASVKEKN
jgi:hypothetical protein